jgi:hypothetical protein
MKLLERAKLLQAIGFLEQGADLAAIVAAAESGEIDAEYGPATALLVAAGKVLEIRAGELSQPEDIPGIIERIRVFTGSRLTITDVSATSLGPLELEAYDEEEDEGPSPVDLSSERIAVRFRINGNPVETQVIRIEDSIDLGFIDDIQDHLDQLGEKRQICPLVELMDDTARFVFIEPAKMEEAELREVITAPDFEDEDED